MPEVEHQNDGLSKSTPNIPQSTPPTISDGALSLPKNRSTGNLLAEPTKPPESTKIRFSLDAGKPTEYDPMARSPIMSEHEHGLGVSGLRRIRQQPLSRNPTLPPSPELSFTSPSRSSSMTLSMPSGSRQFTPGGPSSPTLNFSEDLSRFPSESLHSFSFAHQSEDAIYNRQNVLKRSIDFMRDRLGWAANHPGLVRAQAKINGDVEVQSMLELLARANVLGNEIDSSKLSILHGPLTGPANIDGENVFERNFLPRSESPDELDPRGSEHETSPEISQDLASQTKKDLQQSSFSSLKIPNPEGRSSERAEADSVRSSAAKLPERVGLKRTYTDTSSLSLQTKLMEAMSKPYTSKDGSSENHLLAPEMVPSFGQPLSLANGMPTSVHGHSHRWAPAAQAIFTTESHAPWTILAANDLACLVFGVTKAEVKKLGILEVVKEDRRDWLEEKLKAPGSQAAVKARTPQSTSRANNPGSSTSAAMGGGITAMLLSKPPARSSVVRKAQTDDGSGSSYLKKNTKKGGLNHQSTRSRGVLLCGDVVPILKRNGATGSASLWVKEKRGTLIWVLEEIVEDVAELTVDGKGKILTAAGAIEIIWGEGVSLARKHIHRLIPQLPLVGGSLDSIDYIRINKIEHFAAKNPDGFNVPVSIQANPSLGELRVSSFPHIAGIMVLSATTLQITSSNSVFSAALFGQSKPNGLVITKLIPRFDKLLNLLTDEDQVRLVDGIVIPEHSFRRARALLALREGSPDAANVFLRPSGLTAKHRDGSDLSVDVQMRVVKSETLVPEVAVIEEKSEDGSASDGEVLATSEVVYALWITYSRHLHSAMRPGGATSPLMSRPGTPPRQPSPGQSVSIINPQLMDNEEIKPPMSPMSSITEKILEATTELISAKPHSQPPIEIKAIPSVPKEVSKKKAISDFIILEDMGQGAYGQVKLARYKRDPQVKVVLKYVTKKRILVDTWTRDRRLGTVPLEIHVLDYLRRDGLRHPNILEMNDFFEDNINYYIEMVPHGLPGMDLFDYIEMRSTMEEGECKNIFLQVVAALHHLHTKALVVHRDIKDENIVLDGENRIKLIDFGSAAYIKNGPFDVFVGTIDYAAPEVLQGKSYRGKEQDVWALGILLYTLVYKENPFYSVDEILDHELRVPWIMSDGSIDLIRSMLDRDVEKRLTISQVKDHPWCTAESEDET